MEIEEYIKSSDLLEKREAFLFDLIDKLDKDSLELFSEVIDLKKESIYKYNSLSNKIIEIENIYLSIKESYDYLDSINVSNYIYVHNRYQLKKLVTLIATLFSFMNNALLGITAFIILNKKISNDFINDIKNIDDYNDKYDDYLNKLDIISKTLLNCSNIMQSKIISLKEHITNDISDDIIYANAFISSYIDNNISIDTINNLDVIDKRNIIKVLKEENKDTTDLYELLETAKENNNKNLTKKYKKN